jgi:alpha/beta superfamily hydrolase
MDSNVVWAICQGLNAAGIASLRFNFRGVGRSEGSHSEGVGEADDVLGALAYLAEQPGIAADSVGLAGYSFGARVSLFTVARAPTVSALFCVAAPLREPLPADSVPCPLLILVGSRDSNVAEGVDRYAGCLPDPSVVRVVDGTDHFWRGFESVLVDATHEFFTRQLLGSEAQVPR